MSLLSEALEKLVEDHVKTVAFAKQYGDQFERVLVDLQRFEPRISLTDTSCGISITGDKHVLEACFRVLRREGFKPTSRPTANSPVFSTLFEKEGCGFIYFAFSSTFCRRVKVGTKTVEVDVFETVCGEQEFPPPTEPSKQLATAGADDVDDDLPF